MAMGLMLEYLLRPRVVTHITPSSGLAVRLDDDARKCVVFFGVPSAEGDSEGVDYRGTGFLVQHRDGDFRFCYLVTAKHVARNLETGGVLLRANTKDGGAQRIMIDEARWRYHDDSTVDVAVTPFRLPEYFDCLYFDSSYFLTQEKKESKNIGVGDLAQIVGLFRLVSGEQRNLPIVHNGHISLFPDDEKIPIRDRTTNEIVMTECYLVEAQTLEGLSGSPVFARRSFRVGVKEPRDGSELKAWVHGSVWLLGLWQGAWDARPGDLLAKDKGLSGQVRVPVGMGIVVPAFKIKDVLESEELREQRRKALEARHADRAAELDAAFPATGETPQHKEDFTPLLTEAVQEKQHDDQT